MSTRRLVRIATTLMFTTIVQTSLAGREWRGHVEMAPRAADCAVLPRPHMRVRLTIAAGQAPGAASVVRQIVDQTWRAEGLNFDWVEGSGGSDAWTGLDAWIAIVAGMPTQTDPAVMGQVLFQHGVPLRLIRISIDAAVEWVRRDQAARFGTSTRILNQTLGDTATLVPRALGLIAAHEIGHLVLGSPAHPTSGVMQATFTRPMRLLTRLSPLGLDPNNRARLRARLVESAGCP